MEPYMKEALEIVKAQASVREISEEDLVKMVQRLSEGIRRIAENDTLGAPSEVAAEYPDPLQAIKEKSIACLECGKKFKVITKRHLAQHDLTTEEYKEKYGYPKKTTLVCKALGRSRRNTMRDMKLWERRKKK